MNYILFSFFQHRNWHDRHVSKKKTEVEMELTGPKMLLMVEKDIRGEICCAVHRFANAKNKYMKTILQIQIRYTSYTRMLIIYMDGQCLKSCLWMVSSGKKA